MLHFGQSKQTLSICCRGYLGNEKATRESITPDGWFKTGDVAVRDKEGLYYIVDRKKELIKYKGCVMRVRAPVFVFFGHLSKDIHVARFQVPPADLEGVLMSHHEIADAGVIGVYSEKQATELPR